MRRFSVTQLLIGPVRALACVVLLAGCTGKHLSLGYNDPTLTASPRDVVVARDGLPTTLDLTLSEFRPGVPVTMSLAPSDGIHLVFSQSKSTLALTAEPSAAVGPRAVTLTATDGTVSAQARLNLTVAVVAAIDSLPDYTQGEGGKLQEFMSTSFQPAPWQWKFFVDHPDTTDLANLNPHHIHVQAFDKAVPWRLHSTPESVSDWDFGELDAMLPSIAAVGDHSPLFQIAVAPPFFGSLPGGLLGNIDLFASYCANLVAYYNTGGFRYGGQNMVAPAGTRRIDWWGIFGDYNVVPMSIDEYTKVYTAAVQAMKKVDATIKISAVEYADYLASRNRSPTTDFTNFVGAVKGAMPDVLSLHVYPTVNLFDPDLDVLNTVKTFTSDVADIVYLARSVGNVFVWVTQSNINADVPLNGGSLSQNYSMRKFQNDPRGTRPFFAAWRPYEFASFAKAGVRALYHWDYTAGHDTGPDLDLQSSEVDYSSGTKFISYWVDYWLGHTFPVDETSPSLTILGVSGVVKDDAADVEVLAARSDVDATVAVMVVDYAPEDDHVVNGSGVPRTVIVDVSALPKFSGGELRIVSSDTDTTLGPSTIKVDPTLRRIPIQLNGYGVAFLKLIP